MSVERLCPPADDSTVPVSVLPSLFRLYVLLMVRSPNFISLVHLPSIPAANADSDAAHRINVEIANFFIWTEILLMGTTQAYLRSWTSGAVPFQSLLFLAIRSCFHRHPVLPSRK